MSEANPEPEPDEEEWLPVGLPLDEAEPVPVVLPVSAHERRRLKAQPHFGWAILWTLGFAAVLFGTMLGIVFVAAVVLAATGRLPAGAADGTIPPALADPVALSTLIAYLAALGFTLVALRVVAGRDWPRQIGLRRPPWQHVLMVVIVVPGFMMASNVLARVCMELFGKPEGVGSDQMLQELFSGFPAWFAVLVIGVAPGVVEEMWFRGFLGRGLVGRYGLAGGVLLTSLFFGLLHAYPPWYVLTTACMGVGLHLVYLASRSLWVPILLHTLNNSISVLGSVGSIPLEHLEKNAAAYPVVVLLLGAGLLVSAGIALATGRVRLVPADPTAPTWRPPFPGVAYPPRGANAVPLPGRMNRAAVALAVVSCVVLVYLLVR